MAQTVLAYLLTALAAAWVIWSVLLPKSLKRAIKAPLAKRGTAVAGGGPKPGCGDDCGCGD
jgi:hypothetical protein